MQLHATYELAKVLLKTRFTREHPVYLIHAVTARCNARCGFCAWNPEFYEGSGEMTTDQIKKLYTDARQAGFVALSMWGGEPLLRPDIGELARHAKQLGLMTQMVTNGALLEKKMDAVVPYLDRICISVDHPSSRHDTMRGVKGLYGKILASTLQIRARYPETKLIYNYTVQRSNADPDTIEQMAIVMKTLGVAGIFNPMRIDAATNDTPINLGKYNPCDDEIARAFGKVAQLKKQGYPIVNSYTHLTKLQNLPMSYRCHWPKVMLPIEANGDVVDCMAWGQRPIGNIQHTELSDILDAPRLRELAGKAGEACHKCVSVHRVDISEAWEGRLEPALSWLRAVV